MLVYLSNKGGRNKAPALVSIHKGDVEKALREPCISLIEKCPCSLDQYSQVRDMEKASEKDHHITGGNKSSSLK